MVNLHVIEEHHQIIPSLQRLALQTNCLSLPSCSTILHFDSHSDVGHIRTPQQLPKQFLDPAYPFLENLHIGNPFTLLNYYGILKNFFWFSPNTDCVSVCTPHIFNTIVSNVDEIYQYSRSLRVCINDLYSCKASLQSFYRRLSIDSSSNLDFILNSPDYAVIDTNLRTSIFSSNPFILDICLDYFCCSPDIYSNPICIEVTEDFYFDFLSSPLHPLKLKLGPLVRPKSIKDKYFIDIGGFQLKSFSYSLVQHQSIVDSRFNYFIEFLNSFTSMPDHIYLCRSNLSNYTPPDIVDSLQERLIIALDNIFSIQILDETCLFSINS